MFNAEEDDWMPTEEEEVGEKPPLFEAVNSIPVGDAVESISVEAPGGDPDVRDRTVSVDAEFKTGPPKGTLTITVSDPERHGDGQMAYVTYNVKTKSKRTGVNDAEVRRRYSDFEWLNKQLERENPMRIIPQIPGKMRTKKLSRFDEDFIERRRHLLNHFLGRVASNKALSQSSCFLAFIQQPKTEFDVLKKSGDKKQLLQSALGAVNSLRVKSNDEEFQHNRTKVSELITHLVALEKNLDSTRAHMIDMATEMNETGPIFAAIGNVEPVFEQAMSGLDKGVAMVVQEAVDKAEDETIRVIEKIIEFKRLCESVLQLLSRRDAAEQSYDKASDDVAKKEAEKMNTENNGAKGVRNLFSKKDPEVLKQERLETITADLSRLSENCDKAEAMLKTWNYTVKSELERFELIKTRDLRNIFACYTNINLAFYARSKTAFERALPIVQTVALPREKSNTAGAPKQNASAAA